MEPSPPGADGPDPEWSSGAGNFGYFSRLEFNPLNPSPITAIAFDPIEEIIWAGNANGKIASFAGENSFSKYSAFAPFNSDIRDIDVNQFGVFSLSATHLRSHSRQGLGNLNFTSRHMENMNCMYRLATAPTVLLGGDQKSMIQFDLEKQKEIRVANISEKNAMIIRSSGTNIYTADTEGNISQRSMSSLDTLRVLPKVHGGPVNDFDISGNKLITCGCSFRVNSLHGDPYVKVYDLRMFQAQKPLALSFAPVFTRFLPSFYDSRVIFCSQLGEAQINDINGQAQAVPLLIESAGCTLMSFGISSTCQLIAFGDEYGNVHLYADRLNPVINEESFPTEFADSVLGLPHSFQIDDLQTPLASIPMPFSPDETLLSDWPDEYCEVAFRKQKPVGTYQSIKTIQYVTYAKNPNLGTPFQFFNKVPYILNEEPVKQETLAERPVVIPQFYRRIKAGRTSKKSNSMVKALLKCNKSATVPLVHFSVSASAVNPIVHLLYIVPAFRNVFLGHICDDEHCIACQLGFLFRMLSDHVPTAPCSSTNLLRSMIASGFPPPWVKPVVSTQEVFTFMIGALDKSFMGEESRRMEELLETELILNLRCVRCGEMMPGEEKRMLITLQYSNASVADHLTLSSLIEKALHQRGQREGDCSACKTKTRLEESRKVKRLPPILMVDANPTAARYQTFWEGQLKLSERRPKYRAPDQEYILGHCGGKTEKICRYGPDCRNRPNCKYSHGMGDWETECETWLSDTGGEWRHFLSKSFTAKLSNGIAILSEQGVNDPEKAAELDIYELVGCVVEIIRETEEELEKHMVTLLRTGSESKLSWVVINDVLVTEITAEEALHLDHRWKLPLAFIYASTKSGVMLEKEKRKAILDNVFQTDCNLAGNDEFLKERSGHTIPAKGDIVGIDAEFVDVGNAEIGELGKKTVGRVSCVDATGEIVLIDDYVITCVGTVVDDYLTAYSGIMEDDLDPAKSTKHLTTLKRVYLKLLRLIEKGVIFVGHGLHNDFSVLNIYVPPEQIRDTVYLFHLADKRYISLQFLVWHILGEKIQETTHDSVVDARAALQLYKKYLQFKEDGTLLKKIQELYEIGNNSNWRLSESPTKSISPISCSTE